MQKIYDLIVYRKLTNPYTRYIEPWTGRIWDVAAGALATSPTYGDTDVQHTADNTYINGTPIKIPKDLPVGDYDMVLYDAATPSASDVPVLGKRIMWGKDSLTGLPIDL